MVKSMKAIYNEFKKDIIDRIEKFFRFMICFFIAIAFIRLFLLLQEYNYSEIISYGEKVTILIGALSGLTFAYASSFEETKIIERNVIRKIGERFLKSFLYFIIGLVFSIGFRDAMSKPSVVSIFPDIVVLLSFIIMMILFFVGFALLIVSAVYLGLGIDELTKQLSSKAKSNL